MMRNDITAINIVLVIPANGTFRGNHRSRELTFCMYHAVFQKLFGERQPYRCLVSITGHIPRLTFCRMVKQDRR